jgi:hypothetical protein
MDQVFSLSYDWAPPPPPPLFRHKVVTLFQPSCVSLVELSDGGEEGVGGGGGGKQIIGRRESLVPNKTFITLCSTHSQMYGLRKFV